MEHRALIESFYEAGGPVADDATLERVFHPDYVSHTNPPDSPQGVAGAVWLRSFLESSFSGIRYELVHAVVDGDAAAMRVTMAGEHTGEGLGMPPTGRSFKADQMHMVRFAGDGRIVEHWGVRDDAGMMRQLRG
jgi:predicted ester cyclase